MKKYKRWSLLCLFAMLLSCFTGMAQENVQTAESEALEVEVAQPIVDETYELEAQLEYTEQYNDLDGDDNHPAPDSSESQNITLFQDISGVSNLKITSTENELKVTWDAVAGATGYEVRLSDEPVTTVSEAEFVCSQYINQNAGAVQVRACKDNAFSAWSQVVQYRMVKTGDVNGDNVIDTADLELLSKVVEPDLAYCFQKPFVQSLAGDVNHSGSINSMDVTKLQSYLSDPEANPMESAWRVVIYGDVDEDGNIHVEDLQKLQSYLDWNRLYQLAQDCYGSAEGDAGYQADADVNGDGQINGLDISMISASAVSLSLVQKANADVNEDGILDETDVDHINSHMNQNVPFSLEEYISLENPTEITISQTQDEKIQITWTQNSYADGYDVEINGAQILHTDQCQVQYDQVKDGRVYHFRIRSRKGNYYCLWSNAYGVKVLKIGDVNFDGAVDGQDSTILEEYASPFVTKPYLLELAGDVDGDGSLDEDDAALLSAYLTDPAANPLYAQRKILLYGDITQDGKVSNEDLELLTTKNDRQYLLNLVQGCYGAVEGDANFNPEADLVPDGQINSMDLTKASSQCISFHTYQNAALDFNEDNEIDESEETAFSNWFSKGIDEFPVNSGASAWENGCILIEDVQTSGVIQTKTEKDWYEFTPPRTATYTLEYTLPKEMFIVLFDESGVATDAELVYGEYGDRTMSVDLTQGNTYYIEVYDPMESGVGCYSIKVQDQEGTSETPIIDITNANTSISASIDVPDEEDWFRFCPRYGDTYTFTVSEGFSMDLYKMERGQLTPLTNTSGMEMTYPNCYYIKITMPQSGTGQYTLSVSGETQGPNGRAFETQIGDSVYYSNLNDGGKLYKNTSPITAVTDAPLRWLCAAGTTLYISAGETIYSFNGTTATPMIENIVAYYLVADGTDLYFSNWSDSGRIYKYSAGSAQPALICKDSASWLQIEDGYIYYYNGLDGGQLYRVSKTAQQAATGEKVTNQ